MLTSDFYRNGAIIGLTDGSFLVGMESQSWLSYEKLVLDRPAFYFPKFFVDESHPWLQFSSTFPISHAQLIDCLPIADEICGFDWISSDPQIFYNEFTQLKKDISSKKIVKAVPYSFLHTKSMMSPSTLQHCLAHAVSFASRTRGILYGFWSEHGGILGVTPELLFEHKNGCVRTMALAGTRRNEKGASEALINDPKELDEHRWVVEGIKASLAPFAALKTSELSILELPTLVHLKTDIFAYPHLSLDYEEWVKILHPTPALGVYPRDIGWNWLNEYNRKFPRNRFGAPVGVKMPNSDFCAVAIRNIQWDSQGMHVGAGCGVVEESVFENEANEISLKFESIKNIFGFR